MSPILPAILSCQSTSLNDEEKKFFSKYNPLGINLFSRNIASKQQIKQLVKEIKETIGRDDVMIAIDQEGGRVRRLIEPEFRSYSAAIDLGLLPLKQARDACKLHCHLIANDLNELDINVNYAPVLDIAYPQTSDALKSRCFSETARTVFALGKVCVSEYISNGIIPCMKHMPGHGRADIDPHLGLPTINESLKELEQDFGPFKVCNDAPMGMTAHIIISAVDDSMPVTMSKNVIKTIIRKNIGFKGLLISDAIEMRALKGTIGERARLALEAGCDCICYALGDINQMQEIADSCPAMTDSALKRFEKAKNVWNKKVLFANLDKTAQNYRQLIGEISPYQDTYDATEVLNKLLKEEN